MRGLSSRGEWVDEGDGVLNSRGARGEHIVMKLMKYEVIMK